jgi:hypothetical protein
VPLPGTGAERDLSLLAMTLIERELGRQAGVEEQCAWALARARETVRSGMIAGARRSDGPPLQLDFADARLMVDDTAVQADTLISQPGSWRVYLRASPAWLRRGHDPLSFRPVMTAHAEDDRGGSYLAGRSKGQRAGHPRRRLVR